MQVRSRASASRPASSRRVGDAAEDVGSFLDDVRAPGGYSVFRQERRHEYPVRVSWFGGVETASRRVQRGFRIVLVSGEGG
jgi:hypothetical protein